MSYRNVRLRDGRTELAWVDDPVPFNWSQITPRSLVGTAIIVFVIVFAAAVSQKAGPAGFIDTLKGFGALWLGLVIFRRIRGLRARFRRH